MTGGRSHGCEGIDNLQYGYQRMEPQSTNVTNSEAIDVSDELKISGEYDGAKENNDQPLSEKEQHRRMERLQDTLKNHNIEISYNEEVNRYAIKVLDTDTKEVVKEIPSEKTLKMFARMLEIEGLLVDEKMMAPNNC